MVSDEHFLMAAPRRRARSTGPLAVLLLAGLVALGFLGALHPAFDSFAHFRLHLAAVLALLGVFLLLRGRLASGILAGAVTIGAALSALGMLPPPLSPAYLHAEPAIEERPTYRLLHLNLRYDNPDTADVLSLVGRVDADAISFNEVSRSWAERLTVLESAYPYSIYCPFSGKVWGVALLSRRPFAPGETARCDTRGAFAVAPLDLGGRRVEVATLHLGWPWPHEQAWQVRGLHDDLATLGETAILTGDFNAVPWSRTVANVAAATRMKAFGPIGGTYMPTFLPAWLRVAGLPIDQVLAGHGVQVLSVEHLGDVGSDHVPVLVQFTPRPLPAAPGQSDTATASLSVSPIW